MIISKNVNQKALYEFVKKFKELGLSSKLIAQVHDELVVDTLKTEVELVKNILKEVMENVVKLDVLLEAELSWGDNWDMK